MIVDILERRLRERRALVPVEALLSTCEGSRMPDVEPRLLTDAIARRVVEVCPTGAFTMQEPEAATETQSQGRLRPVLRLSYAECIGCRRCIEVGEGAVVPAKKFPWSGVPRAQLVRRWDLNQKTELASEVAGVSEAPAPAPVRREIVRMLGRALNVRQLDPGSCNGCEAEITALTNPYYDLERFGIHFVASPKHADMLLVTGPVTRNMLHAVKATYEAVPAPKLVVAVGACGCSGGIFADSYAVVGPVDAVLPVDGYIPGCPPTPAVLVSGILRVLQQHRQPRDASH